MFYSGYDLVSILPDEAASIDEVTTAFEEVGPVRYRLLTSDDFPDIGFHSWTIGTHSTGMAQYGVAGAMPGKRELPDLVVVARQKCAEHREKLAK